MWCEALHLFLKDFYQHSFGTLVRLTCGPLEPHCDWGNISDPQVGPSTEAPVCPHCDCCSYMTGRSHQGPGY